MARLKPCPSEGGSRFARRPTHDDEAVMNGAPASDGLAEWCRLEGVRALRERVDCCDCWDRMDAWIHMQIPPLCYGMTGSGDVRALESAGDSAG